jgi:FtsZ-binding cell division protein ZapB
MLEKLENKVLQIDQTIHILKGEQGREKETVNRLEINTLRTSDDFKQMVTGIQ